MDQLKDDPFRSLAGALRRAGGFAKDTRPFSEFLWADFLRRRMDRRTVDKYFAPEMKGSNKNREGPGRALPAGVVRPLRRLTISKIEASEHIRPVR